HLLLLLIIPSTISITSFHFPFFSLVYFPSFLFVSHHTFSSPITPLRLPSLLFILFLFFFSYHFSLPFLLPFISYYFSLLHCYFIFLLAS
ncbi:hypothetical protein C1646_707696, partial [Rhizophagus diaphanus]